MNQEQCKNCIYHWRCEANHEKTCRLKEHMQDTFSPSRIVDVSVRIDIADISKKMPMEAVEK